jgi:hypothetical protein
MSEQATTLAEAWAEGHITDEHGPGLCECENPYEEYAVRYGDGQLDGPMSRSAAEEMIAEIRRDLHVPRHYEPMTVTRWQA